ncbi:MAG: HD domain-containing protein [Bacteroidetes bacterium]|nr:HD domain-containing protein [Bacteroidota bacterium]MBS1740644.1 HD domain-containing protein [Bacteroidota bacterium]MBS1777130.1 HD domain-containing protein [Bacteroidota bacterium]
MSISGKIINDPVYGFIRFPEPELMVVVEHPWFQRLRHIKQMGMAHLVYPGATHTRFHHSLGACHLMGKALDELKLKDIAHSKEEYISARLAILLHDIGHGPFSHALEHSLVEGVNHETLSSLIIQRLNVQLNGLLNTALQVFDHAYPRQYLHQLVSSQLDVDRMDYLNRDSFYTGVSEGVIGYDRILQMLTVKNNELMVEEKAVQSVEKFIIARRLMYWQVYLHKTVLGAEQLLVNILKRAKELAKAGYALFATPALHYFLYRQLSLNDFITTPSNLDLFCTLDDSDIWASIKVWATQDDVILSRLCSMIMERNLYKTILTSESVENLEEEKRKKLKNKWGYTDHELNYFVCSGSTSNHTYNMQDEKITIALKNGNSCDISQIDNTLINQTLARPVHKNYICYVHS